MRKRRARGFRPLWDHLDDRCLPSGYSPSQVAAAYGVDALSFRSSSGDRVAGDGTGQTIAIVDLYHDPNLQASLDAFDARYNLPSLTLQVINQAGNQTDPGWAEEETLDVEWAHAMAPGASLTVIEGSPGTTGDDEFNNTLAAIRMVASTAGVSVVSMSWGYGEFPDETSYDSNFTTTGVTFVAASGDDGTIEWPATSADVLSVGGTSLKLGASGGYGSETGWSRAGGGLSTIVGEPAYQNAIQSVGGRSTPDVAFDADPYTGVSIYVIPPDSTTGRGAWQVVGGTSVGAPAWAGLLAIVNQGRAVAGRPSLTGATQTVPALYSMPAGVFNKAAMGSGGSGSNTSINTTAYNTQVGLGSPVGPALIDALVNTSGTSPTPTPSPTPTSSPPPGRLPTPIPPIPIPTPTPSPTPPPPVMGPAPAPLPTPTPSPTPPPAPPPQPPPRPVLKHKHHARATKPPPAKHRPLNRHPAAQRSTVAGKKAHPGPTRRSPSA